MRSYGSSWVKDGIGYAEGPWWTITLEASDPPLTAEGTYSQNWNESHDAQQYGIGAQTYVLDTPDGRWEGSGNILLSSTEQYAMIVLDGQGGYEGLTATVLISTGFSSGDTFVGVITPGEPPEMPEAVEPPAE